MIRLKDCTYLSRLIAYLVLTRSSLFRPSLEGKQLVLSVSLIDTLPRPASWGYKLDKALGLRKVIIEHFITRYGKEKIDQVRADLATGIGAPIGTCHPSRDQSYCGHRLTMAVGFEFDTSQVIASEHVTKIDKFNELVTYLKTLYDLPGQNITGKAGVTWLCNHNPTGTPTLLIPFYVGGVWTRF